MVRLDLPEHQETVWLPDNVKSVDIADRVQRGARYFRDGNILALSDDCLATLVCASRPL